MPTQTNSYPVRCNDKDAAYLITLSSKIIRCFSSDIIVSLQKQQQQKLTRCSIQKVKLNK